MAWLGTNTSSAFAPQSSTAFAPNTPTAFGQNPLGAFAPNTPTAFGQNTSTAKLPLAAKKPSATVHDRRIDPADALNLTGPVFQVIVGEEGSEETITVHEKLFTAQSHYFANAVKGKFLESEERVVRLKEVAPKVFRLYVNLLYTSKLATKGPEEWLALCRLYVLAEYLLDRWAKNRVIHGMHTYLTEILPTEPKHVSPAELFSAEAVQVVYDGTPEGSHLRRLVIDLYAIHGRDLWLKNAKEEFPTEFLYDIALKMLQVRPQPDASWQIPLRSASDYYEVKISEDKKKETPLKTVEPPKST